MIRMLGLVVALLAGASPAIPACPRSVTIFPPDHTGVPPNVVFQVTSSGMDVPSMFLFLDGVPVEIEVTGHGVARWITVRPLAPLISRRTYLLRSEDSTFSATFIVADENDATPPSPRQLLETRRTFTSAIDGKSESLTLSIPGPVEELTAAFVFSGESPSSLQTAPSAFTQTGVLLQDRCSVDMELQAKPNLAVAIRVVDVAGNLSELSAVKQAKSAGCSSAPALLGILGVLTFLRRRRTE